MLNKIYVKTKKFIKENYKILVFFLIFIILFNIELAYEIYSAGGIIDVSDRIEVKDGIDEKGSFNLTYVSAKKGVLPFVALSYLIKGWDLVPLDESRVENESYDDIFKRNQVYLKEGINNSIISAFKEAKKEIEILDNHLTVLYILEDSLTNLQVGDEIISINGRKIQNTEEFIHAVNEVKENTKIIINVKRNNQEIETESIVKVVENEKIIGIYLVNLYDLNIEDKIKVNYKNNEGGSSGGLINALYIYNELTEYDITNGMKISGTGTIDERGNVGDIAGIKYKLLGACNNKSDVFLVPYENYEEALKVKNEYSLDIALLKVNTLSEAINKLMDYKMTK